MGIASGRRGALRGHNPIDLAENLRGMKVVIRSGNGQPGGPYSGPFSQNLIDFDPVEALCWEASNRLHQKLQSLGIDHIWDDYGPGSHTFPYYEWDLTQTLPIFMEIWSQSNSIQTSFSYSTIKPSYKIFDWDIRIQRTALEFSKLETNHKEGFKLTGSGDATIITPAHYGPGTPYSININGPYESTTITIVAGKDRRLTIPITLGPANQFQEYTAISNIIGSKKYTVTVKITPGFSNP